MSIISNFGFAIGGLGALGAIVEIVRAVYAASALLAFQYYYTAGICILIAFCWITIGCLLKRVE